MATKEILLGGLVLGTLLGAAPPAAAGHASDDSVLACAVDNALYLAEITYWKLVWENVMWPQDFFKHLGDYVSHPSYLPHVVGGAPACLGAGLP